MAERRTLQFGSLDDVLAEVERLRDGHQVVGHWTLAQICDHLASAITLSAQPDEGPSPGGEPDRTARVLKRRMFGTGRFPSGVQVPTKALEPRPDVDQDEAIAALGAAIRRFEAADGPFRTHPYLGPLDGDEWARFHCIHCAHHLGFAMPR